MNKIDAEVLRVEAQQALKYSDWQEVSPLPELPFVMEFHKGLVPNILGNYIFETARSIQCSPDYVAVTLLTTLSGIIGNKVLIQPKQQDTRYRVSPNLNGLIIGTPSTLKTPSTNSIMGIIAKMDKRLRENYQAELAVWLEQCQEVDLKNEQERKTFKEKFAKDSQAKLVIHPSPEKPIEKRYLVNDTSIEVLQVILSANQQGVIVYRDEIHSLFLEMQKKGMESARGFYLSAFNGLQSYRIDRMSRESVLIEKVCLSLFGTIQPSMLQSYLLEAIMGGKGDDGFMQRFSLMVYPDSPKKFEYIDSQENALLQLKIEELFQQFADLDSGQTWKFSSQAQVIFSEWLIQHMNELRSGELHKALEAHLGKYDKLVCSLSLMFSLVNGESETISESAIVQAIKFLTYIRSHAERVYSLGTAKQTPLAKLLLKKLPQFKERKFTKRELERKCWSGLTDKESIEVAIDGLLEHGYIRLDTSHHTSGRPPSPSYSINPCVFTDKTDRNHSPTPFVSLVSEIVEKEI